MPRRTADRIIVKWLRHRRVRLFCAAGLGFAIPILVAAIARAAGSDEPTSTGSSALSWMGVTDSAGVKLSNYKFATDVGGAQDPARVLLSFALNLEFSGWLMIITTAIWLIGYALSFEWLAMFSTALRGTAEALTDQIATPLLMGTAASIGAVCVGWFTVRGYHGKATVQVVTMLTVAICAPVFLAQPLSDVLAADGLLAKGRDLGISVAAGLNGDRQVDPRRTAAAMQVTLADNFARHPLQVWNFGHVVDGRGGCGPAWTQGVRAGSTEAVKKAMAQCMDSTAVAATKNPDFGQLITGLVLLLCGTILLLFAAHLAIRVIRAALNTIYHGFMAIFGFAAGGYVYGPTQTYLVRNIVDGFIAAARMVVYTVYLGVYLLFLGNLFALAEGRLMAVFMIVAIAEVVAISQLHDLTESLDRGAHWISNRLASSIQHGGGSGGGTALGMGQAGAKASLGKAALNALSTMNTINTNPLVGHVFRATNPFNIHARRRQAAEQENLRLTLTGYGYEAAKLSALTRDQRLYIAKRTQKQINAPGTALEIGEIMDSFGDVSTGDMAALLLSLNLDKNKIRAMQNAHLAIRAQFDDTLHVFRPLKNVIAAAGVVNARRRHPEAENYRVWYKIMSSNFAGKVAPPDMSKVDDVFAGLVMSHADDPAWLDQNIARSQWNNASFDTLRHIGYQIAQSQLNAAKDLYDDPTDAKLTHALKITRKAQNLALATKGLRGLFDL